MELLELIVSLFVVLLGLGEKLLLKPKSGSSLQTERVPRSSGEAKYHFSACCLSISHSSYFYMIVERKNKCQRCDVCFFFWVVLPVSVGATAELPASDGRGQREAEAADGEGSCWIL